MAETDKTEAELLAELRAAHGDIEALRLESGAVVALRKPTLAEYLDAAEAFARLGSGQILKDPGILTKPLLALVVHGMDDAKAELKDCPGFDFDLYKSVKLLAGEGDEVEFKEAPDAVTPEAAAASSRAIAFRCNGTVVCARPFDRFDWVRYQGMNAAAPVDLSRKVLAEVAEQQVIEAKDAQGRKPNYDALTARWPAVAVALGLQLVNRASSKAKRIEGK